MAEKQDRKIKNTPEKRNLAVVELNITKQTNN